MDPPMSTPRPDSNLSSSTAVGGDGDPSSLSAVANFVNDAALRQHLRLLSAIDRSIQDVEQGHPRVDLENHVRMSSSHGKVFRVRAVQRYERWIKAVLPDGSRSLRTSKPLDLIEIPPLDVLVVLHAHLLNPWRFYEDSVRLYPVLHSIGPLPLADIASLIDPTTFEYKPTALQIAHWERLTGLAFDPLLSAAEEDTFEVSCPSCARQTTVPVFQYVAETFAVPCRHCAFVISKDALCVAKFMNDVVACAQSSQSFLAGTLLDFNGVVNEPTARAVARAVLKAIGTPYKSLGERCEWRLDSLTTILKNSVGELRTDSIDHLLFPYKQFTPFCFDLAKAVHGQGYFATIMHNRRWSRGEESSYPLNTDEILRRYNQFLAMVAKAPTETVSPPYDIDLAWHTHQLAGREYHAQTLSMFGTVLDHNFDDEDAAAVYELAWKKSAIRWKELYGEQFGEYDDGDTCPECGGAGCDFCNGTGGCGNSMSHPSRRIAFLN